MSRERMHLLHYRLAPHPDEGWKVEYPDFRVGGDVKVWEPEQYPTRTTSWVVWWAKETGLAPPVAVRHGKPVNISPERFVRRYEPTGTVVMVYATVQATVWILGEEDPRVLTVEFTREVRRGGFEALHSRRAIVDGYDGTDW